MSCTPQQVKSLFLQALERPAAERDAFLDAACADEPELKARVQVLLRSADAPDSLLDHPPYPLDATHVTGAIDSLEFLEPCDVPGSLGRLREYVILEVIGRGGMGIVLRALDEKLNRVVAIKVLVPELAGNVQARKRFLREAQAAAAVSHDHVVTIHAVDDSETLPFLVMECILGQSLQQKIDRSGPLGLVEILRIGMQTAAGLAAAHGHGLVHRDVKPANILLENGIQRVKLSDFGLARMVDDASVTQSGLIAGTPQYMSPEQARGELVDARSDLFSLGCVLYAMCTGHAPFRASTTMGVLKRVCEDEARPIRDINPDLPEWLDQIVTTLMAKSPEQRYSSSAEVADLLRRCLAHVQQPGAASLPEVLRTGAVPVDSVPVPERRELITPELRRQVLRPARLLAVTGVLNWLALIVCLPVLAYLQTTSGSRPTGLLISVVYVVLAMGSGLILFGAGRMAQLESLGWARLSAIASMIIGPGYLVGWPAGIWAMEVLTRDEVRRAFRPSRRGRSWFFIAFLTTLGVAALGTALALSPVFAGMWRNQAQIALAASPGTRLLLSRDGHESRYDAPGSWEVAPGVYQVKLEPAEDRTITEVWTRHSGLWTVRLAQGIPVEGSTVQLGRGERFTWTVQVAGRSVDTPSQDAVPVAAAETVLPEEHSTAAEAKGPSLARAPFSADQAARFQDEWARQLDIPVEFATPLGLTLRLIPPGRFQMGSTPEELSALKAHVKGLGGSDYDLFIAGCSGPRHVVELSRPFYMSACEVTVGAYRRFLEETGHQPTAERSGKNRFTWTKFIPPGGAELIPVCGVSWEDAHAFCEWLTRTEFPDAEGPRYELPTEAQWEFACRAGTETLWSCGNEAAQLSEVAIFGLKGTPFPAPVGLRRANAFGLYDMHGNVDEWCLDWHIRDYYGRSPLVDPAHVQTPTDAGSGRVARGGAWNADSWWLRSATRAYDFPENPTFPKGFRVVRTIPMPEQTATRTE